MVIMLSILVFVAGMLTFLAPCTLPILPAYLAFSTAPSKVSTFLRTLLFGTGVIIVFLVFGLLAGSLGSLITINKGIIATISGIIFILLGGLILAGKELPWFTIQANPSRTAFGTLLFGIIFALSWSGCIGPVLGFVLTLAVNTQTALSGGILLVIYALGLLTPLLIVSVFFDKLPKDGRVWTLLRGKIITVGPWQIQSTQLITGSMLVLLGIIFLFRLDALLAQSPLIEIIFSWEERLTDLMNATR
jgi:cytochrome c-type biogenesis protein